MSTFTKYSSFDPSAPPPTPNNQKMSKAIPGSKGGKVKLKCSRLGWRVGCGLLTLLWSSLESNVRGCGVRSAMSLCEAENTTRIPPLIFTDKDYFCVFWTWSCSVPRYRKLDFIRNESPTKMPFTNCKLLFSILCPSHQHSVEGEGN